MVKKRIRDPEVLEEAPPVKFGAEDSGSDDVYPSTC
jgi:protein BCP1